MYKYHLPSGRVLKKKTRLKKIANFPEVQEQELVQAIPRLVGSPPPVEEFTA